MGIMRKAAVKGLIPSGMKARELQNNLMRLMTTTATVLDEKLGSSGLDALSEVFRRLGAEDAKSLKDMLGLGETLKDALDAWLVIGNIMNAKIEPTWTSDSRVETIHPYCPQYEFFKKTGKLYCDTVCIPYVQSVAEGINASIRMEVVKPATMDHACTKALLMGNE